MTSYSKMDQLLRTTHLVSIVIPTKGRYELLEELLISIADKTKRKDRIEVILVADNNDPETALVLPLLNSLPYYSWLCFRNTPKTFSLPFWYYNPALRLSNESLFKWILGNDCKLITQDWDEKLEHIYLNQVKNVNKYHYIRISDDTHWKDGVQTQHAESINNESCCFPILSSNYFADTGEFYPSEVPTWGGDILLWEIVQANSDKFNMIDLSNEIKILHTSQHTGTYEVDEAAINMRKNEHRARNFGENLEKRLINLKRKDVEEL